MWKFGNNASGHKLVRQHTLEVLKFFGKRLYLMRLLNNRALISHLVVIILFHDIQFAASVRGPKLGLERIPMSLPLSKDVYEYTMESSRIPRRAPLKRVSIFS